MLHRLLALHLGGHIAVHLIHADGNPAVRGQPLPLRQEVEAPIVDGGLQRPLLHLVPQRAAAGVGIPGQNAHLPAELGQIDLRIPVEPVEQLRGGDLRLPDPGNHAVAGQAGGGQPGVGYLGQVHGGRLGDIPGAAAPRSGGRAAGGTRHGA